MIKFVKNKEPVYDVDKYDVVLVGVSTHNTLMGNFQAKIGVRFPVVEKAINQTAYGDLRKLGKRLTIEDTGKGNPIISLMFVCTYPSASGEYINYDALERCLLTANAEFKGKKVMTTIIGSTKFDGRGDRDKCIEIIEKCLKDVHLDIYDYEQISIKEEINRQKRYFTSLRKKNKGNKEMLEKITEIQYEMRKKTFLPTDIYLPRYRRKQDDILNI